MIDLISFGIVIDDIALPDGSTHLGILGGGGPQTVWGMAAARGSGASVGLVAEVGADFDVRALAPLDAARVNLDGVRRSTALTPRAWQRIDGDGGRIHEWQSPPLKSITFGTSTHELLPPHYRAARHFHWGLHPENPALTEAHTLTAAGATVSLETFKPPEQPLTDTQLRNLLSACTVFSPNWSEAAGMIGSGDYVTVLRGFRDAGCRVLALRRGSAGAEVWDFRSGNGVRVPAVPTTVIDTVGAGNAFCGALLATLDHGIETAAPHAVAAASYLVEQYGLPERLPDPAEYNQRFDFARTRAERLALP
ncbi:MAG: carbohydrate kinase family protein [Anaerolinea sp.]|nr:carbohydrate kinase family protein [Anaerolinea sp.]